MGIKALSPSRGVLAARAGKTVRVVGVFARLGIRRVGSKEYPTVLVTDVFDQDTGIALTDHLWFNEGRAWRRARLIPGDIIAFTARVIEYRTGYWGPNRVRQYLEPARSDFRLTPPSDLAVVWRARSRRREVA